MSSESFDMLYMFGAQDESISSISRFSFSADMAMAKPKQCGATTKKGVRCQHYSTEGGAADQANDKDGNNPAVNTAKHLSLAALEQKREAKHNSSLNSSQKRANECSYGDPLHVLPALKFILRCRAVGCIVFSKYPNKRLRSILAANKDMAPLFRLVPQLGIARRNVGNSNCCRLQHFGLTSFSISLS